MNDKKEKPSLLRTVIEATIPLEVGYLLAVVVQFFTMESVIVNVSSSVELNEQYLTIVSVQNLKAKTLSKLSIYIDSEADVLNIKSDNEYKWEDQYIKFDSIAPKSENDIVIWTEQPIEKKQIVAESDYKTRVSYSQGRTPFIIQILGVLLTAGGVIIFGTSCSLWISKKQLIKVQNDIDEFQKKFEKLSKDIDNKKKQLDRKNQELRSYYLVRVSDVQKELSFWRDTVRKLLYDSQNKFQTADKLIETVTATLKTYTTRDHSNEKMDEVLYLAQLISDSKELHSIQDSDDWEKDK